MLHVELACVAAAAGAAIPLTAATKSAPAPTLAPTAFAAAPVATAADPRGNLPVGGHCDLWSDDRCVGL